METPEEILQEFMKAVRDDEIKKMRSTLRGLLKTYGLEELEKILKELAVEEVMDS